MLVGNKGTRTRYENPVRTIAQPFHEELPSFPVWSHDILVGDGHHAVTRDDGLGDTGRTTGVQDAEGVPLSLLEGLGVRERLDLALREPAVQLADLEGVHLALPQPGLHHNAGGLCEGEDAAFRLVEEAELPFYGVARGDKQGLDSGTPASPVRIYYSLRYLST